MKAVVDQDTCIGCGACIAECPEVYHWNSEDKSESNGEIPADCADKAAAGRDVCPVDAIDIKA
ncbi:MAG: ferredoxin [Lachnospiraceae bacterium]|nr:ferredoxin [Lachnospiraceae bacterium]